MTASESRRRPNVLLILTDDQGWDDLGHHGNPWLETPNLDRLARESVQFANYYVASVCAPSRASLLTGRHFLRVGVAHVHGGKDFIHPDEILMSELFQRGGYRTGMWGKWHSGKSSGYFPWERGFEEAYMAQLYKHKDSVGEMNGVFRRHTGWTVDTLTDYAIDFMRRHRNEPFFAFLPHLTVHAPLVSDDALIAHYEEKGLSRGLATVYAMVHQLDLSIGRLMAALDELDLAKDTVVLFMSDNGPAYNGNELTDADRRQRYVNRHKGHKGNMWENGIKSPLFVRWPGVFQPRTVQRLCDICDIFPTLMDICGIEIPADHPKLDGRGVLPYLRGDEASLGPKESFVYVNPGWPPNPDRAYNINGLLGEYDPVSPEEKPALPFEPQLVSLRDEDYKMLQNPGRVPDMPEPVDGTVLIHIAEDPKEDRNVLLSEPERARAMRGRMRAWFEEIKSEPHSFHIPVFEIGPDRSNYVAAYAPIRMRGQIRNGGLASIGWGEVGDGAEYDVRVTRAGRYRLSLRFERADPRAITLKVRTRRGEIVGEVGESGTRELGTLDLEEGRQIIRLEVAQAEPPRDGEVPGPILRKITEMVFERVD